MEIVPILFFCIIIYHVQALSFLDILSREKRQVSFTLAPNTQAVPLNNILTGNEGTKSAIVNHHNKLRGEIKASNMLKMSWNNEAAVIAQTWANRCVYSHDNNEARKNSQFQCGQNIAKSTISLNWEKIIDLWWAEKEHFKFGQPPSGTVGHFTQIAWASTHQVGCAVAPCAGFYFYVCNYCPAGNWQGKENNPYIPGENCAACPGHCENNLCTNACPFANFYNNCDTLDNQVHLCSSNQWPQHKDKCQATCNCKGKAIFETP